MHFFKTLLYKFKFLRLNSIQLRIFEDYLSLNKFVSMTYGYHLLENRPPRAKYTIRISGKSDVNYLSEVARLK